MNKNKITFICILFLFFIFALSNQTTAAVSIPVLTATATSNNQIDLSWEDSNKRIIYSIERSENEQFDFTLIAKVKNKKFYSDTGLDPGTTYYYRIKIVSKKTISYSNIASATTFNLEVIPNAPSNFTAIAVSPNQINLNWIDNSDNETGFKIMRALSIFGPWELSALVDANVTSFSDFNLLPATTYFYAVCAYNSSWDSNFSDPVSATTQSIPTTSIQPTTSSTSIKPTTTSTSVQTTTTTSSIKPTTSTTSQQPKTTSVEPSTSILPTTTTVQPTTTSIKNTTTTSSVTPTTTTSMQPTTTSVKPTTTTSVLVTTSTTSSILTVPIAPSNLTAQAASCNQINLSWQDNATNETGFKVERATSSSGPWSQITTLGANATSYANTGLNQSTIYYYRVYAYNAAGNSSYSNTALTATPACPTTTTTTIGSSSPHLVGFLPGVGTPQDVSVVGNYAYVASHDFGMSTLKVTIANDQITADVLSASNSPFAGRTIAVNGSVAVVTGKTSAGQAHLWVLNVADISKPRVVGECDIAVVEIMDVALNSTGSLAVVAGNSSGIRVVNLSNPAAPTVIGSYDTPGVAYGVAFNTTGSLVYVADGVEGLKVISLSNPQSPSLVGSLKITSRVYRDIAVSGTTAFLANQNGTLDVIDVSTATAPAFLGSRSLTGGGFYLSIAGNSAAVIGKTSTADLLHIVNIATPSNPILEGSATVGAAGSVTGVALANGYAYVAANSEGLKIYKVGSAPVYQTTVNDDFLSKRIAVAGDTAVVGGLYLPASTNRLEVLDIADASQPQLRGECDIAVVEIMDVALNSTGSLAVVAGNSSGIRVVNLSNPAAPTVIGSYDTPGVAYGVAFNTTGSLVYVADGVEGLKVISLSNPQSPSLVGSLKITSRVYRDIAVSGTTAFLANQNGTLDVIDVSTATAPAFLGSRSLTGGGFYLSIAGNSAAVIGKTSTADLLHIVNIATPSNPILEGSATVGAAGSVTGVALANGYAYVAANSENLKIYNLAMPSNPILDTTITVPGTASDVALDTTYAYVAGFPATLSIIELFSK